MKKKLLSLSILLLNTISSANAVLPNGLEEFDAALVEVQEAANVSIDDLDIFELDSPVQGVYNQLILMPTVGFDPDAVCDEAARRNWQETPPLHSAGVLPTVFQALADDEHSSRMDTSFAHSLAYSDTVKLFACLLDTAQRVSSSFPKVFTEWEEALQPRLNKIMQERAAQSSRLHGREYLNNFAIGSLPVLRRVVLVCAQNEQAPSEQDIVRVRALRGMDSDAVDAAATLLDSKR